MLIANSSKSSCVEKQILQGSKPNCWYLVSMTSDSALFYQRLWLFTVIKGQMKNFYTSVLVIAIQKTMKVARSLRKFCLHRIICSYFQLRQYSSAHGVACTKLQGKKSLLLTWNKEFFFPIVLHSYRAMKCKDFWTHFEPNNSFFTPNFLNHCFNTHLSHAIDFAATIAVLSSDESCSTRLARWKSISESPTGSQFIITSVSTLSCIAH